MNSVLNQKSNNDHSLSFEDVSKLFSLPLSEAADILGVSTSVLKKICNENGLVRWPHRKYIAGKTIEEIKEEAAMEKSKTLGRISPSPKSNVATKAHPPGLEVKDQGSKSAAEKQKTQGNTQQPGNKTTLTWRVHQMPASGLVLDSNAFSDEFKYGFPSSGLSESTNRWWGSCSNGNDKVSKDDTKTSSLIKDTSKAQADDGSSSTCEDTPESVKLDEVSLSAVRKRAMEEGKNALNLHALKKYGADKIGNEEKILLRRLFQTS